MNLETLLSTLSIPIGDGKRGFYVFLSKTRHSCSPNVEISMNGDGILAYANRLIPKGTEITRTMIEDLNIPFSSRKDSFRSKFGVHCTCFVCELCGNDSDFAATDDSLRLKISEFETDFCRLVKGHAHEALSVAHGLVSLMIKSATSQRHKHYADMPLLRRLHLRMATLCMVYLY
jgi:hypothetical protein